MKKTILILTLLFTSIIFANDYRKVEIIMENGTTKEGLIKFPIRHKSIKFKDHNGKEEKIKSDDIKRLIITTKKGTFVIDRTKYQMIRSKKKTKVYKNKSWFLIVEYCDKLSMYLSGFRFKLTKDDGLISEVSGEKGLINFWYLFKRPNENIPTLIKVDYGMTTAIGVKAAFRKSGRIYFKDFPSLVERINKKEFKGNPYSLHEAFCKMN